jgi:hypothetical protein
LLFDFFGIFIGLATATILIVHTIRLALWLKSNGLGMLFKSLGRSFSIFDYGRKWRCGGLGGTIFESIRVVAGWWIGAGFYITLLVIFMVGMLRTAQNAWDTARWMFTTYLVVGSVLTGCYVGIYWSLYRKRLRV